MIKQTKNDLAWDSLFNDYRILEDVNKNGFYEIESKVINTVRESRLMAKFDHHVNLPRIFSDNKLSILPISRTKYVIGKFDAYAKVKYNQEIENKLINFPYNIESIDYNDLYSESSALHCAYVSGIIEDVLEEQVKFTISGRMSTTSFDFNVRNILDNSLFNVNVKNSQCEIDAGFEGENSILLIEAKNFSVEDFLIRQLYYPYRLWTNKLHKKVIPALMTYSNDVFSFFIYDFEDSSRYNSLVLRQQKNYIIAPERIELKEIFNLIGDTKIIEEPINVPFPQANNFERVIDLLGLLVNNDLTKDDITENYQFDIRQTDYYTNAVIYLGLAYKYKNSETNEILYSLTDEGKNIMKKKFKSKYISIVKKIIQHEVFKKTLNRYFELGYQPNIDNICEIMKDCYIHNVSKEGSTIPRRAQTVNGWINWILGLTT